MAIHAEAVPREEVDVVLPEGENQSRLDNTANALNASRSSA
jgi:hypothetical protein